MAYEPVGGGAVGTPMFRPNARLDTGRVSEAEKPRRNATSDFRGLTVLGAAGTGRVTNGRGQQIPSRLGIAHAATKLPNQPGPYGLAFDLAHGEWVDHDQFVNFVKAQQDVFDAQRRRDASSQNSVAYRDYFEMHRLELERAHNMARFGHNMTNEQLTDRDRGNDSLSDFFDDAWRGAEMLGNEASQAFSVLGSHGVSGRLFGDEEDIPTDYETYTRNYGLLTEEEFTSFDEDTRRFLVQRAMAQKNTANALELPVIKQVAEGFEKVYRFGTAAGLALYRAQRRDEADGSMFSTEGLEALLDPKFRRRAMRDAEDFSIGQVMLMNVLAHDVDHDTMMEWQKHSGAFQFASLGSEFLAGWYLAPDVLVAKGVGNAMRVGKKELPLDSDGKIAQAIRADLSGQRELINLRAPGAEKYATWRADSIRRGRSGVENYARSVSFAEFSRLPMFRSRHTMGGTAAARALYDVANGKLDKVPGQNTEDLMDLTWRLLHGDPKAQAMVEKMDSDPGELAQWGPKAQTFLDAYKATQTHLTRLDNEIAELQALEIKSPFHEWSVHTDIDQKQRDIAEAESALQNYEGYGQWLASLAPGKARVGRVQAPKVKLSTVEKSPKTGPRNRLFMDSHFGYAHRVVTWDRALFTQKNSTVSFHDNDSGIRSIERQFDNMQQYGAAIPESIALRGQARQEMIDRYSRAQTPQEKAQILYEIEHQWALPTLAERLNIAPEIASAVYRKIRQEENRIKESVVKGSNTVYDARTPLGERLRRDLDENAELVSRDDENGMVTIKLMDGREMTTVTVPESAIERWTSPFDSTQTGNYYQPLDMRRVYLEMKRHQSVLEELGKGDFAKNSAALGEFIDKYGTIFNNLWKPAQLWRVAWPARVLLDEGFRNMAILGPMHYLTGVGAEHVLKGISNVPANFARWVGARKGMNLREGPGTPRTKTPALKREQQLDRAPQVPFSQFPKINEGRYNQIIDLTSGAQAAVRARNAMDALAAEFDRINLRLADARRGDRHAVEDMENLGIIVRHAPGDDSLSTTRPGSKAERLERLHGQTMVKADMLHPLFAKHPLWKITDQVSAAKARNATKGATDVHVFDPISGKEIKNGYIVPVFNTGFDDSIASPPHATDANFLKWYEDNAELLSRQGMRVLYDPESNAYFVGRYFDRRAGSRKKVNEFLEQVHNTGRTKDMDESGEPTWMWDLSKGQREYVQDADALNPLTENIYRQMISGRELAETESNTPALRPDGTPEDNPVYHGTYRELPEDLLPREDAPFDNGNMVGQGLYTTVSKDTAEFYGPEKLYTIRGSKSGKVYKTFDLDSEIQRSDVEAVIASQDAPFLSQGIQDWYEEFTRYWASDADFATRKREFPTWANFYEYTSSDIALHNRLHRYLEHELGVGAITHRGGNRGGNAHQVYVWLRPEDLEVRPLYTPTGDFYTLEDWFTHPYAVEDVPENRIHRAGERNPMMRELHTIHAKRVEMERGGDLTQEYDDLLDAEIAYMDALGLSVTRGVLDTNAQGQKWYTITDLNKFHRIYDEATAEDMRRDLAGRVGGALRYLEDTDGLPGGDLADAIEDFDLSIDSPRDWIINKIMRRREAGKGWMKIRTGDGKEVVVRKAFEGHQGEVFRSLVSSDKTFDFISEGHGGAVDMTRRVAAGHKVVHRPEFTERTYKKNTRENREAVTYFQQYADMVNDHLGNSPIMQKLMKGQSNAEIADWINNSAAGARFREEVGYADNAELYVHEMRERLNHYVPSRELQRLLTKGRIKPSDLRKKIHDDDLPDIYAPDVDPEVRHWTAKLADNMWKSLGTIPTDVASRHPFFNAMYQTKMRNLIGDTGSKWLDQDTVDRYEGMARQWALEQVRRTLFDLTTHSNFTDAVRFMAPFWGAQEEAIKKWLRIVSDRPETVFRFFNSQDAVYNNFVVWDEENQEVVKGERRTDDGLFGLGIYHPEDRVIVRIPEVMKHGPFAEALQTIGSVGIPIGSANTVLQGEYPVLPGPGPLLTVPVDAFMRVFSETNGTDLSDEDWYKWLFPVGRDGNFGRNTIESLVPGWGRRVAEMNSAEDTKARANLRFNVERELRAQAKKNGLPPPTEAKIQSVTKNLWMLRAFTSNVSPVRMQFLPQGQYFINQAHKYRELYGQGYMDKFMDDFGPEAVAYAASSSTSLVPPTISGMEQYVDNKELIGKFPEWAGAIISPEAFSDRFSQDVYEAQFEMDGGIREVLAPRERIARAEEIIGWNQYRKFMAALEVELAARGLTSINQSDAYDLRQLKSEFSNALREEYPAWGEAKDDYSSDIYTRVGEAYKFAFDKRFDGRPDIEGLRQYLLIRDQVGGELDRWYASGTSEDPHSQNLQAEENGALRMWFYEQVGQVVMDNPAFAELYYRYLDEDAMELGSGFYGVSER